MVRFEATFLTPSPSNCSLAFLSDSMNLHCPDYIMVMLFILIPISFSHLNSLMQLPCSFFSFCSNVSYSLLSFTVTLVYISSSVKFVVIPFKIYALILLSFPSNSNNTCFDVLDNSKLHTCRGCF